MTNIYQWLTKNIGNITVALLFALFVIVGIVFSKDQNVLQEKTITTEYKLKDGTQVATNNVKIISEREIKQVIKSKSSNVKEVSKKFSKVKGVTQTVNKINIDTIAVRVQDSVKYNFQYNGSLLNDGYKFDYSVNQHGFTITNFEMIDTTTTIDGKKRTWLLGKSTENSDTVHSNKNIKTTEVEAVRVKESKSWYWSGVAKGIYLGILGGAIITASQ